MLLITKHSLQSLQTLLLLLYYTSLQQAVKCGGASISHGKMYCIAFHLYLQCSSTVWGQ